MTFNRWYLSAESLDLVSQTLDGMASSPETGGFHTPRSMSGVYYEEDGQHSISVEVRPAPRALIGDCMPIGQGLLSVGGSWEWG